MKKILSLFVASVVLAAGAFAADLTVDSKFDFAGKSVAGNYLSIKGSLYTVDKATVDPSKLDAISGASLPAGVTERWNTYRSDVKGKNALPGGLNHLLKYGVSPSKQFIADLPKVWTNADGSITIQFLHRGTAIKLTTDATGKLNLPGADVVTRKIGNAPAEGQIDSVISTDFSKDGTVAGIDWKKVWDPATPAGNVIAAGNTAKTGLITVDKGVSELYLWTGALQVTVDGTVVGVKGELNAVAVAK